MNAPRQFFALAFLISSGLATISPAKGDESQTSIPVAPTGSQTNGAATAKAIKSGQDAANDLLNSLLGDKPPEMPKNPPGSVSVVPPPAFSLVSVDQARLNQVGAAIARQLEKQNDAATRKLLVDAGSRIVAENDRRVEERSAQPPPTRPLNFDGNAYRQLVRFVAPVSEVAAGTAGTIEPQKEIARTAFEGSGGSPATPVTPSGTRFFSGKMQAMNDPTPYNPIPVVASTRVSDLNLKVPPLSSPSERAPSAIIAEKGVRIQYDATALDLASQNSDLLEQVEDRLLGSAARGTVGDALVWADGQIAQVLKASERLEKVSSVSLKAICDAAAAYNKSWSLLPDALRHPGGLHRILGFVIDSKHDDLILIGSTEGPGEAIDLDDITIGFRAVWKAGLVPICSLEPVPGDFGGPQRAIVAGVERNTHFARIMLDADYKLKTMLFSAAPLGGFRSLKDIVTEEAASGSISGWMARFWFTPVQPGEGEIRLSSDDQAGLFNASIQVVTEDMRSNGATLVGTGSQSKAMADATGQFTRQFDRLERDAPVVAQLHGLFDIVLLADVLRTIHAPTGIIGKLLELPTIAEEVPESYPGLTLAVEAGGIAFFHMAGGVTMDIAVSPQALLRSGHPDINGLPMMLPGAVATLPIPISRGNLMDRSENEYVDAIRHSSNEDYPESLALLDGLLARDSNNARYFKLRSRIYAHMSLYRLAEEEWLVAARLAPQDPSLGVLRLQIAVESGVSMEPRVLDGGNGDALAALYFAEAGQQRASGGLTAAIKSMSRAVSFRPNNPDFWSARADLEADAKQFAQALTDANEAIRLNPSSESSYVLRASLYNSLHNFTAAVADATRAIDRKPHSLEAYLVRARAKYSEDPPDPDGAYRDVQQALGIDRNDPHALDAQAHLLAIEGDRDGAFAAVNRAIKLYPGRAAPYAFRATLYADNVLRSPDQFVQYGDDALAMLTDLNKVAALDPSDTGSRRIRVDLVLAYGDNFGNAEIKNWSSVIPVLIKDTLLNSPAAFKRLQNLRAPSDPEEVQRNIDVYRSAAVLFAMDELEDLQRSAPPDQQAEIRKKVESLRAMPR